MRPKVARADHEALLAAMRERVRQKVQHSLPPTKRICRCGIGAKMRGGKYSAICARKNGKVSKGKKLKKCKNPYLCKYHVPEKDEKGVCIWCLTEDD